MLLLDFTGLKFQPAVDKKLALIDHPDVDYILISSRLREQGQDERVTISIGRNFLRPRAAGGLGGVFRAKDIGGGHPDAAGAASTPGSKPEQDRLLEELFQDIIRLVNEPSDTGAAEGA